ncbi:hypothetical protein ACX93W_05160 [Paenibacillus sp. CAU 1782]
MKKAVIYIILFISIPIIINYGLLSWRAPGVNGDVGDWIGFFANFLGVIGAVVIALYQLKKQKEHDEKKDIENNRSFVDVHDFRAPMMLIDVKTHENSRIVMTEGYELLKKSLLPREYRKLQVPYFKISHHGSGPFITNCSIKINLSYVINDNKHTDEWDFYLASIEKDVEIFIPLVPLEIPVGVTIDMNVFIFKYVTVKGEKLTLYRDYKDDLEFLRDEHGNNIYMNPLKTVDWIYPNKIVNKKEEESK